MFTKSLSLIAALIVPGLATAETLRPINETLAGRVNLSWFTFDLQDPLVPALLGLVSFVLLRARRLG